MYFSKNCLVAVKVRWLCQAKLKLFDWVIFESDYAITIISLRLAEYEIIKSKSMLYASCVNYQLIFGAPSNNNCYWSRSGFIRSWVVNNLDSMHKNHEGNFFPAFYPIFLRDERALITLAPRFINGNLRPTLQITSYASHTHPCHMIHTSKRKNQSSKSRLLLDNHTSCTYLV